MSDVIGYQGAPPPAALRPALSWVDALDARIHDTCTADPNPVYRAVVTAGRYAIKRHVLIPGFAAALCVGLATGDDRLRWTGALGVAGLMATATASRTIKTRIKRRRPDECPPRRRPGRRISARSFPSGHAASAFAAATALASATRTPAAAALVYGGAALLVSGRVTHHRHWTSDVVAGALLGTTVTLVAGALLSVLRKASR